MCVRAAGVAASARNQVATRGMRGCGSGLRGRKRGADGEPRDTRGTQQATDREIEGERDVPVVASSLRMQESVLSCPLASSLV